MSVVTAYLEDCREIVLDALRALLPRDGEAHRVLYSLMLDYPLREAKGLRPGLCIAVCRALGGQLEAVVPSAAVLELFHNAFLIHDDIEDQSELRRGAPTLHHAHGVPIAVNVGDAMLALALGPLLENTRVVGLGKALRILETVAVMCRESVEGQALELDWMRHNAWDLDEEDYVRMVEKKTSYYTFVAPVQIGCLAAGCGDDERAELGAFARVLGIAFQIQDDLLNLDEAANGTGYGKELAGDLWEGKRTLILLHALRAASEAERARALAVLRKPRVAVEPEVDALLGELVASGELAAPARARVEAELGRRRARTKTAEDVAFLKELIDRADSVAHARAVARRYGEEAAARLEACAAFVPPSVHRDFLGALVDYVHTRVR